MTTRQRPLTKEEIQLACEAPVSNGVPMILSPLQLAEVCGLSVKTIYEWVSRGRLDGAFRKRGKHNLFWRDRVIALIFNGPEWK